MHPLAWLAIALIVVGIIIATTRKKDRDEANGIPPPPAGFPLPDVRFGDGDRPSIVTFADTGRKPGDTHHRIEGVLVSANFFALNTGDGREGHIVVQTRTTVAAIYAPGSPFRALGWIAGSLFQQGVAPPFGIPDFTRRAAIEDWQKGAEPEGFVWLRPESVSPQLEDHQPYRFFFESWPAAQGWFYRYGIGGYESPTLHSTNTNIDPNEQAIGMAAIGPGVVEFTDMRSTWSAGPA